MLFTDFPDGTGWTCRGRFTTLAEAGGRATFLLSVLECNEAHIADIEEGVVVADLYSHRDANGLHITTEELERVIH